MKTKKKEAERLTKVIQDNISMMNTKVEELYNHKLVPDYIKQELKIYRGQAHRYPMEIFEICNRIEKYFIDKTDITT